MFILASHGELFFGNPIQLLLVCSADIEINPGPKTKNQITFCHWNLNGLAAHNFTKVSLLQALSVTHDYDIICLLKNFLIRLFQMKMKELILKVTIFYGQTIQVTKKRCLYVL